jgi:hypothetical protein
VVAATGPAVERASVEDKVYALSGFERDGAAADDAVLPEDVLAPKAAKPRPRRERRAPPSPASALGRASSIMASCKRDSAC